MEEFKHIVEFKIQLYYSFIFLRLLQETGNKIPGLRGRWYLRKRGWGCLNGKKGEMVEGLRSCFGRVLLQRFPKTVLRCSVLIHTDFKKMNKLSIQWKAFMFLL